MAKVFIKLNWATANAFLPSESRPAIEKNIGAIAEQPSPAKKKPKNAIANAKFLFAVVSFSNENTLKLGDSLLTHCFYDYLDLYKK